MLFYNLEICKNILDLCSEFDEQISRRENHVLARNIEKVDVRKGEVEEKEKPRYVVFVDKSLFPIILRKIFKGSSILF